MISCIPPTYTNDVSRTSFAAMNGAQLHPPFILQNFNVPSPLGLIYFLEWGDIS